MRPDIEIVFYGGEYWFNVPDGLNKSLFGVKDQLMAIILGYTPPVEF